METNNKVLLGDFLVLIPRLTLNRKNAFASDAARGEFDKKFQQKVIRLRQYNICVEALANLADEVKNENSLLFRSDEACRYAAFDRDILRKYLNNEELKKYYASQSQS